MDQIFFFKQKTAYEMRISDWSSDVCSSDLEQPHLEQPVRGPVQPQRPDAGIKHDLPTRSRGGIARLDRIEITGQPAEHGDPLLWQIGRASCRERVCQYV